MQCPRRNNFVIIWNGKSKTKIQKRVLQMTVKKGYFNFIKECVTKIVINYTLPFSEKDTEVCYCVYHERFDLLLFEYRSFFDELGIQNVKNCLK